MSRVRREIGERERILLSNPGIPIAVGGLTVAAIATSEAKRTFKAVGNVVKETWNDSLSKYGRLSEKLGDLKDSLNVSGSTSAGPSPTTSPGSSSESSQPSPSPTEIPLNPFLASQAITALSYNHPELLRGRDFGQVSQQIRSLSFPTNNPSLGEIIEKALGVAPSPPAPTFVPEVPPATSPPTTGPRGDTSSLADQLRDLWNRGKFRAIPGTRVPVPTDEQATIVLGRLAGEYTVDAIIEVWGGLVGFTAGLAEGAAGAEPGTLAKPSEIERIKQFARENTTPNLVRKAAFAGASWTQWLWDKLGGKK